MGTQRFVPNFDKLTLYTKREVSKFSNSGVHIKK